MDTIGNHDHMGLPQFGLTVVEVVGTAYQNAARASATYVDAGRILHALVLRRQPVKMPLFWRAVLDIDKAARQPSGVGEPPHLIDTHETFSRPEWRLQTLMHDIRRGIGPRSQKDDLNWSAGAAHVLIRALEVAEEHGVRSAHTGHLFSAALAVEDESVQLCSRGL